MPSTRHFQLHPPNSLMVSRDNRSSPIGNSWIAELPQSLYTSSLESPIGDSETMVDHASSSPNKLILAARLVLRAMLPGPGWFTISSSLRKKGAEITMNSGPPWGPQQTIGYEEPHNRCLTHFRDWIIKRRTDGGFRKITKDLTLDSCFASKSFFKQHSNHIHNG